MTTHHRLRIASTIVAVATVLACSLSQPAGAEENKTSVPRVRSSDVSITELIDQAITRSPTFKRLVATVEASNGIIYVELGVCVGGVRACLPTWMSSSGSQRFMRIIVDRKRFDSNWELVGAIGHELQHAIEVLSDRSVTDTTKMYFFFRRHAPTNQDRFETQKAVAAGLAVGDEFRIGGDADTKRLLGNEASDRGCAHIGIPETHHSISHHGNDAEKLAKYAKIGTYQIVKLSEFADKLKATKDGDGNLLDHSLLYWGSGMSNGNQHDRNNPPAVLVGGANGKLKGNRHVQAKQDEPTANLLLSMCQMAGAEIDKFGASTGKLDL